MHSEEPIDVVTGGAGFIGSHLAEVLLTRGRRVRVVDDLSSGEAGNVPEGADFLRGDVMDLAEESVRGADVVYHLAAIPSVAYSIERPMESHRANVETTLAMLMAAERAGVRRFVFVSSSAVYGDTPELPRHERQELRPLSPYAVAKLCGEAYLNLWAARGAMETVALRFFNVYGPRQNPNSPYAAVVPLFLERLLNALPLQIYGNGHQTRDFTYVRDAVQGAIHAGQTPQLLSPCYNIASGRRSSVLGLATTLAHVMRRPLQVDHLPARAGEVFHSWADVSRARREITFSARTSLEDGLRSTASWFVQRQTTRELVGARI